MPVHNATIAAIFDEIADLLDIQGANTFRIRAYRNAARTVGELGTDVKTLKERGTALTDIPGIGEDLAKKIDEILETGKCEFLERLRKEVPPAVTQLLKIPGLGPKRVKTLWHDLDIQTLDQLLRAAKDGRIRELHGFGEKTEQHILEAAQVHLSQAHRFKLAVAAQYAEAFVAYLRKIAGVEEVIIAGSFRRMRETVGDIDILVAAEKPEGVMDRFIAYEEVKEVLASGPTRGSVGRCSCPRPGSRRSGQADGTSHCTWGCRARRTAWSCTQTHRPCDEDTRPNFRIHGDGCLHQTASPASRGHSRPAAGTARPCGRGSL